MNPYMEVRQLLMFTEKIHSNRTNHSRTMHHYSTDSVILVNTDNLKNYSRARLQESNIAVIKSS